MRLSASSEPPSLMRLHLLSSHCSWGLGRRLPGFWIVQNVEVLVAHPPVGTCPSGCLSFARRTLLFAAGVDAVWLSCREQSR